MARVWLKSEPQIELTVDYDVAYDDASEASGIRLWTATNFTINLWSPYRNLECAKVSVVLINQHYLYDMCLHEDVYIRDFTGNTFWPMQPGALIRSVTDKEVIGVPQIAFVVDGDWQRDPIQGGAHNFNFAWTRS